MSTYTAKPETVQREWLVVDATNKTLGRLATKVATVLRGKHKPEYTQHVDVGDYVIILNAEKIRVTGNKVHDKTYHRHSGYPGGLKSTTYEKMEPRQVVELAIKGMLPKNPLGRAMFRKLKVYVGADHQHQAQQPRSLEIEEN